MKPRYFLFLIAILLLTAISSVAETGEAAWLRFAPIQDAQAIHRYAASPSAVVSLDHSEIAANAERELARGIGSMLGKTLATESGLLPDKNAFVLGTVTELQTHFPEMRAAQITGDGFWLKTLHHEAHIYIVIAGADERGILYGAFALLSRVAQLDDLAELDDRESPAVPIRWVDQWDNPDGSIERGYAGRSIFFDNGHVRGDLTRVGEYARLLASIGINGCNVNNVNAAPDFSTPMHLQRTRPHRRRHAPLGRAHSPSPSTSPARRSRRPRHLRPARPGRRRPGGAPKSTRSTPSSPTSPDSPSRPTPKASPAPPATAAPPPTPPTCSPAPSRPTAAVVLYRAFVYNHHLDWRDPKADRARAAYDIFHPLDGKFAPNVVIQTKEGPIDFQAREPVSPLFAGLEQTNQAMELQITQEYTGQQRHLVYLAPMWKQVLDFDLRAATARTPVKRSDRREDLPSAPRRHGRRRRNVGRRRDWLGSPLAMANLYAFGRLAWNPDLSPDRHRRRMDATDLRQRPQVVVSTIVRQCSSHRWPTYESYTGPLGMQTLTDITGPPLRPQHRSQSSATAGASGTAPTSDGIGMDRTVATGTGYIGQYPPGWRPMYESLATCPDDLLLFFHHVPYTYKLHSRQNRHPVHLRQPLRRR